MIEDFDNIDWITKETPPPSVDKKNSVLVSINNHLRDAKKKRLNLTIPEKIIKDRGLVIGSRYAVAVSGRSIFIRADDFGFTLARVGAGVGTIGGKISLQINTDILDYFCGDDGRAKFYISEDAVQNLSRDTHIVVIHL